MSSLTPINKAHAIHSICESNFQQLLRLVPQLDQIDRQAVAHAAGKPPLHLQILEKNPYTTTLELSHFFEDDTEDFFEPAVKIRVYLDARTAEVLQDSVRPEVTEALNGNKLYPEVVDYKWSLNYFLQKWLGHCLQLGYSFAPCFTPAEATL